MTRVAVIGAGLSGLVVARELSARHDVTVFEKSRGVGGRIATRYADRWEFDHGAQYFVAKTRRFREFLAPMIEAGVVASWNAEFVELSGGRITVARKWTDDYPHYVGTPRMNSIGKWLALPVDVRTGVTVSELQRSESAWILKDAASSELGRFDWVISTAPAAQTARLLPPDCVLGRQAADVVMQGCYSLMLGFEQPLALDWQAALIAESDLSWASVNSSKPGRDTGYALVFHSTNAWADRHIDDAIADVEASLLDSVTALPGIDRAAIAHCKAHRWRHANVARQDKAAQIDTENRLAVCGDWTLHGRVEAAFSSACRLLAKLDPSI